MLHVQSLNPDPWHRKFKVLTTGPPENSCMVGISVLSVKSRGTGTRPGLPSQVDPPSLSSSGRFPSPCPSAPQQPGCVPHRVWDQGPLLTQAPSVSGRQGCKALGVTCLPGIGCSCPVRSQGWFGSWSEGDSAAGRSGRGRQQSGQGPRALEGLPRLRRMISDRKRKSSGQADHARKQPRSGRQCLSRTFPAGRARGSTVSFSAGPWPVLLRSVPAHRDES